MVLSLVAIKLTEECPQSGNVRGLFSVKVPNSSFADVRMGLLIEPTHMEDEDEDQENEKEDERDGEECRVESRIVSRRQHHADDTWMKCAPHILFLSQCHVRH